MYSCILASFHDFFFFLPKILWVPKLFLGMYNRKVERYASVETRESKW